MLGLPFRSLPQDIPEDSEPGETPLETARRLAAAKAVAARDSLSGRRLAGDELILGADTVVVLDGRLYGKPRDRTEARAVIKALAGREHEVISAIAVCSPRFAGLHREHDRTTVRFRAMTPAEIEWYLDTEEWADAAGGYKAQGRGAWFVDTIHGSFYSVMGLPIHCLYSILRRVSFRF